jgi:hypothetical protein
MLKVKEWWGLMLKYASAYLNYISSERKTTIEGFRRWTVAHNAGTNIKQGANILNWSLLLLQWIMLCQLKKIAPGSKQQTSAVIPAAWVAAHTVGNCWCTGSNTVGAIAEDWESWHRTPTADESTRPSSEFQHMPSSTCRAFPSPSSKSSVVASTGSPPPLRSATHELKIKLKRSNDRQTYFKTNHMCCRQGQSKTLHWWWTWCASTIQPQILVDMGGIAGAYHLILTHYKKKVIWTQWLIKYWNISQYYPSGSTEFKSTGHASREALNPSPPGCMNVNLQNSS